MRVRSHPVSIESRISKQSQPQRKRLGVKEKSTKDLPRRKPLDVFAEHIGFEVYCVAHGAFA